MRTNIYFIQAETGGPIKIGKAASVEQRIQSLQPCCPVKLIVLTSILTDERLEAHLHERFREYRIHGEWFLPNESLYRWMIQARDRASDFERQLESSDRSTVAKKKKTNTSPQTSGRQRPQAMHDFAGALRSYREKNGLTILQLANKIGVTSSAVRYWESKPAFPTGWARAVFVKALPDVFPNLPTN